ncbi:hypothetical protein [Paraburkholderia sp. J63]|uniref:hypothetical protein n=1 Tax=Paraburkholderia sp. J63 TaxID=2805434 RepID=UPI002ABDF0CE|nr:hypothetical protein [Paraburkholderia sp. J63]
MLPTLLACMPGRLAPIAELLSRTACSVFIRISPLDAAGAQRRCGIVLFNGSFSGFINLFLYRYAAQAQWVEIFTGNGRLKRSAWRSRRRSAGPQPL